MAGSRRSPALRAAVMRSRPPGSSQPRNPSQRSAGQPYVEVLRPVGPAPCSGPVERHDETGDEGGILVEYFFHTEGQFTHFIYVVRSAIAFDETVQLPVGDELQIVGLCLGYSVRVDRAILQKRPVVGIHGVVGFPVAGNISGETLKATN
jgi:hypothetical protein